MAIVVEHDKRRREILEKALDVFVDEGFENATYQKIADRSGITRTTLYFYFRNKREVFLYSIKQFLSEVEADLNLVRKDDSLSYSEKLKKTISLILDTMEVNARLLTVILDYLLFLAKSSEPGMIDDRVRRRTIKLRHILSTMVIDGIKAGEFKKLNVKTVNNLLYGLIETGIFHLTVLKQPSSKELRAAVNLTVDSLKA
jgi:AcrR family transcriptional regulator